MFSKNSTLSRLFRAESRQRSGGYRQHVREAARFVFCTYHGIEVSGIRERKGELVVHFNYDHTSEGRYGLLDYVEMLISGALAVQVIFGGENEDMVDAITEAERVYRWRKGGASSVTDSFESMVHRAGRNASMHMADPKMRAAISTATRFLARQRSSLSDDDLTDLRTLVTRSLT